MTDVQDQSLAIETPSAAENTGVFDEPEGGSTPAAPTTPTEPVTPTAPTAPVVPEPGVTTDDDQPTAPVAPVAPTEPKLYAGKYDSPEKLRDAFIQLGGDPTKYDTPEKLEEAYDTRQQEFTRSRQDYSQTPTAPVTPQLSVEEKAGKLLQGLDWNKIGDAKDLVNEMAKAIVSNPELFAQGAGKSTDEMAAELAPKIAAREVAQRELSEIETEVPRLKKVLDPTGKALPNPFRDAFAVFVQGQKHMGKYVGLKASMKDFMQANAGAIDAGVQAKQTETQLKNDAAATAPGNGGGNASVGAGKSAEDDILEGILEASSSRHKKFL